MLCIYKFQHAYLPVELNFFFITGILKIAQYSSYLKDFI